MKLLKFRVTNFRSVKDSGWIECDGVTTLIGANESGKSNMLTALWKLHPAKGGEINPTSDYPRKSYNQMRQLESKPVFIQAEFELNNELISKITGITGAPTEAVTTATVSRDLSGGYQVSFPFDQGGRTVPKETIRDLLAEAQNAIGGLEEAGKGERGLKDEILTALGAASGELEGAGDDASAKTLEKILGDLEDVDLGKALRSSTLAPQHSALVGSIKRAHAALVRKPADSFQEARDLVLRELPSFVYYSNYGNLDSEIYLPHVIQNLKRTDLTGHAEAKARTLKVLFEFVGLDPQEVHQLGQDFNVRAQNRQPTDQEIQEIAEKKKEREILLQSASAELTETFRNWWKQGTYRFRFQADGDHFRIWVSDDRRPEEIELEGRSTGLQWFLSFYLVFLVESSEAHKGAILLLDEAGLSLHPLAQEDLAAFFDNLAETNQVIHSTHSPFLIDPDHLDRVRSVYVDDQGFSVSSPDLRANAASHSQFQSVYAVHAALGLTVSHSILWGSQPVIVEGPSDQYYLSALKTFLVSKGVINPKRDIVFVPAGGVRGVSAVASILSTQEEKLPFVLVDSDRSGSDFKKKLLSGLYNGVEERIIEVEELTHVAESEVEDLFPADLLADVVSRQYRGSEVDFSELVKHGEPIVPQIEDYAAKHGITLRVGWKVDLAREVKRRLLQGSKRVDDSAIEMWKPLFEKFNRA